MLHYVRHVCQDVFRADKEHCDVIICKAVARSFGYFEETENDIQVDIIIITYICYIIMVAICITENN